MRVAQEPGVIRFGKALAPVIAGTAASVHPVDQPQPAARLDRDQRGQRHPLVTAAGHPDHRIGRAVPRSGPRAVLSPGLTRLRSRPRRPGPPPCFYHRPGHLPPPGDPASSRSAARRAGTCTLHRAGAAAHPAPPGCTPPGPAVSPAPRSGPTSSTGPPSPHCRARIQHRLQLTQLTGGQLALGTASALRRQRGPSACGQRPPPPVHRHPRLPETLRHLPVTSPRLDQLSAASRTCSRRARSCTVSPPPSGYLITPAYRGTAATTRGVTPQLKIVSAHFDCCRSWLRGLAEIIGEGSAAIMVCCRPAWISMAR